MFCTAGLGRIARWIPCLLIMCAGLPAVRAQLPLGGFVTGQAAETWELWEAAMQAVLAKDDDSTEAAFGDLLAADPSPLRLAIFRARTPGSQIGGAVLLFEQDVEAGTLGDNGKRLGEMLSQGIEQMNQADDGWWFAGIGRFDVANANFEALLNSDPDPVALLEFADQKKRRHTVLVQLINQPVMGKSAARMIKLLSRGESLIKADPGRIKNHIQRLGGPPRAFENAVAALKDSGEYAPPFLVQALRDPDQRGLTQAILRCLPMIDRGALNPLVMALRMNDPTVKGYLIGALGRIPYRQSLPYLLQLKQDPSTPPQTVTDTDAALASLRGLGIDVDPGVPAARLFYSLAEAYYENRGSLSADPRLDTANVWYWRDDMLQNIEVPTAIFDEVMCMRSCEEALRLDPSMKEAIALWIAANFRREAQLEAGQTDDTRPHNYPSAAYFAQSGGAEYCMSALARAVRDADSAVALGTIEALQNTAGAASLVGDESSKQPLADALSFPNRLVRIRAALALGHGMPVASFNNYQNLMPVLSEALMMHGGSRGALIIDPDEASLNAAAAILRGEGYTVLTGASLLPGLEQVRKELPGLDVIFVASDIQQPNLRAALDSLRADPSFRALPVVIISKRGGRDEVRMLTRKDHRLTDILPDDEPGRVLEAIARVSKAVGFKLITEEFGRELAFEAAITLGDLAKSNNTVFDLSRAQSALVAVITSTDDPDLRLTVAEVLGYLGSAEAQESIAGLALDASQDADTRIGMLGALSQAAKRHGNRLGSPTVDTLIDLVKNEQGEALRTAAARALGSLNLPSNRARELIIKHYGG